LSNLAKAAILLLVILGIGAGLVVWKNKVGGHAGTSFNSITRGEIEMLLADVAKVNPMVLKRFADDPEMKKKQIENLKQLLAFASEAQKEGLDNEPEVRQELENIRSEVIAVNYDREINKDKGPMPPFGFITEDRIKEFWGEGDQAPQGFVANLKDKIGLGKADHEMEFEQFLNAKVKMLKEQNPQMKDKELSDEERTQARDFFAKIEIYQDEYEQKIKSGELPPDFKAKVDLQIKLQQAQFLARMFSEKLAERTKVSDEDIAKYISEHPEFKIDEKKAKAEEILNRAKAGEDFAALANEFTEDPGNKDAKGELQGGLYKGVTKGRMVPAFEEAALALEPGQVSQQLVETDYGYHILKLESKGEIKDASGQPTPSYDVRHILISTTFADPENPGSREVPVKAYVRSKLESEKEKAVVEEIVASNHIEVPDDFTVPAITEEQMKQLEERQRQQAMPMQLEQAEPGTKPAAKKPEAKKAK
jgi:parvulin-like peptidyl-prolyl isomerase